ncbi:MAG: hypothetical protein ACTSYD_02040 [Candidatus Heimdallarchaeaceae archaeon]
MKVLGDTKQNPTKRTVLAGVILLGVGSYWLLNMGLTEVKIQEIIATALVFAGTSVLAMFLASKLLGG